MFICSGLCIVVGVVSHISGVIIGRFLSGFVSAIPSIMVACSIEDIYDAESSMDDLYIITFTETDLALGSTYNSYITETIRW